MPYLEERTQGLVITTKGFLAKHLQLQIGDVLINDVRGRVCGVEFKVEESNKYGNFFLETWSNRNLESRQSYADRGNNQGWLYHLKSDFLFYYFLDSDDLYIFDLFTLKRWAYGHGDVSGNIYRFPEKPQSKHAQLNDTWGRCVPIAVLQEELGAALKHCKAKQLPLFEEAA
jgi:hypothetical protein